MHRSQPLPLLITRERIDLRATSAVTHRPSSAIESSSHLPCERHPSSRLAARPEARSPTRGSGAFDEAQRCFAGPFKSYEHETRPARERFQTTNASTGRPQVKQLNSARFCGILIRRSTWYRRSLLAPQGSPFKLSQPKYQGQMRHI